MTLNNCVTNVLENIVLEFKEEPKKPKFHFRFRYVFMGAGSIAALLIMLMTDPDVGFLKNLAFGSATLASLIVMLNIFFYVTSLHVSRKALMDYLDLEKAINKAMETSEGAGRVVMGVGLMMIALAIVIYAAVH